MKPRYKIRGNPPIAATPAGTDLVVTIGKFDVLNLETDDGSLKEDPKTMADLSGTLVEERVAHATTVQTPMGLTRDRISELIRGGGRVPVERNTTYGRVNREAVSA